MNDRQDRLSDAAIELALARRAPHGADPGLLKSILSAAAGTPQVRWWVPATISGGAPLVRLAWIALLLALVLALAALVVGGGVPRPPDLAMLASPTASSSPLLSTAPTTVGPDPCATETLEILSGDALPTPGSDPAVGLDLGRGVYVGTDGQLWAVGAGQGPATRIAQLTPGPSVLDVLDVSPDGSRALIRAGHIVAGGRVMPGCADLYEVSTDGSRATRLTVVGQDRYVAGAAFSPDGGRIAYASWGPAVLTVLDIQSSVTAELPCGDSLPGPDPVRVAWSPRGDRIAVDCSPGIAIVDPSGAAPTISFPPTEWPIAFSWTDDRHLLVARAASGPRSEEVHIDSFDLESQTSTFVAAVEAPPDIELVQPSSGGFSPDGRWLAFLGWDPIHVAAVGYLVPTSGGAPIRVLEPSRAILPISWSADSRALVYVDLRGLTRTTLRQLEVETLRHSTIGRVPGGRYLKGIWRIP